MNKTSYGTIVGILISIAILLLAAYAYGFWYVKTISEKASETDNTIAAVQEGERVRGSLETLLAETAEERVPLHTYFVTGDGVEFLERVESLGRTAGAVVSIQTVDILASEKWPEHIEWLNVDMEFLGTWTQTQRFLGLIESLPQGIVTQKTTLTYVPPPSVEQKNAEGEIEPYYPWRGTLSVGVRKLKTQ